ncbi:PBECR4 domain-containing protein [Lactococcus lactis]|uniref:PBECR4 domain-containing protein n=1 Tax=Lactococcus lactis TaxID=1358 RepID=UPI0011113D93|nr:PBECR4 domain-containing protein [Lactococcus lactis]
MVNFREARPNERLQLERQLEFIFKIAHFYYENLANKDIYIQTASEELHLFFTDKNLYHLLGIKHKQTTSRMYQDIMSRKLTVRDFYIQDFTLQKLQVMHDFSALFYGQGYVIEGKYLQVVEMEKALRTNKFILALALDREGIKPYFPKSALDIRRRKDLPLGDKILSVHTVDRKTGYVKYLKDEKNSKR